MFILDPHGFRDCALGNAAHFVQYWRQFYRGGVTVFHSKEHIDYSAEMAPSQSLTAENVRRMLRWKDPKFLTEDIVSGPNKGQKNPKVAKIVNDLSRLNAFREGRCDEETFLAWASMMFPSSGLWVWRVFLVHLARPFEYPIVDQHVLRVYGHHTGDRARSTGLLIGATATISTV